MKVEVGVSSNTALTHLDSGQHNRCLSPSSQLSPPPLPSSKTNLLVFSDSPQIVEAVLSAEGVKNVKDMSGRWQFSTFSSPQCPITVVFNITIIVIISITISPTILVLVIFVTLLLCRYPGQLAEEHAKEKVAAKLLALPKD